MDQLTKIIVLKSVDRSQICTRQPTSVCRNSAYVIDLHSLDHPTDIRADDNEFGFVMGHLLHTLVFIKEMMVHTRYVSEAS